jgi:hypothetical protein
MSNVIDFQAFKDNLAKSHMAKAFSKANDVDTRSERVKATVEKINSMMERLGHIDCSVIKERKKS